MGACFDRKRDEGNGGQEQGRCHRICCKRFLIVVGIVIVLGLSSTAISSIVITLLPKPEQQSDTSTMHPTTKTVADNTTTTKTMTDNTTSPVQTPTTTKSSTVTTTTTRTNTTIQTTTTPTAITTITTPTTTTSECTRLCHGCSTHNVNNLCLANGTMGDTVTYGMIETCPCHIHCYSEVRNKYTSPSSSLYVHRGCVRGKGSWWEDKHDQLICERIVDSFVCYCLGELCNTEDMTPYM